MKQIILFLAVLLVMGCVNTPVIISKGVLISMDANPKEVFGNGITTISVDVENQDVKTLREVTVDIFETGSLDKAGTCAKTFPKMEPKDFGTFACNLRAKNVERDLDNKIWAKATYKATLSAVQTFDIISQTEFELRKKTGKSEAQKTFSFRDNNLELLMELSNSPVIDASDKEFVSFRIRNIGSGFIEQLGKADIQITSSLITNCPDSGIYIIGREFPRFSCALNLPGGVTSFLPVQLKIDINYNYEIRNSVDVRILKGAARPPGAPATTSTSTTTTTTVAPAPTPTPIVKRVFVTSTLYNGNLGGLTGGDAKCQERADAANLGGNWVALLSDSKTNAKDRLLDAEYRRLDGAVIASNKDDLFDGNIQSLINLNEREKLIIGIGHVWTGTTPSGEGDRHCNSWTDTRPDAMVGDASPFSTDKTWISLGRGACNVLSHLYCFEIIPTLTPTP